MIIFNAWASARIAPSGSANNSSQFDINDIKSQAVDGFFANLRSTISGQYSKPNIAETKFVFGILCKLVNKSDINSNRRLTEDAKLIFQDLFYAVRDTSERSKGKHTLYKHLIVMLDEVLHRYSEHYNNLSCICKDEFYKTAVDKNRLNRLINSIDQSALNIVQRYEFRYDIAEKGECRKEVHNLANTYTKHLAESRSRPQTAPSIEHVRPASLERRLPMSRPDELSSSENWFDSQVTSLDSKTGLSSKIVKNTLRLLINLGSLKTPEHVACCRDILAKLQVFDLVGKRKWEWFDDRVKTEVDSAKIRLKDKMDEYLYKTSLHDSKASSANSVSQFKLKGNVKYSFKESITANDISFQKALWASNRDGYTTYDNHLFFKLSKQLDAFVKSFNV